MFEIHRVRYIVAVVALLTKVAVGKVGFSQFCHLWTNFDRDSGQQALSGAVNDWNVVKTLNSHKFHPLTVWCCWLGERKGICPVKVLPQQFHKCTFGDQPSLDYSWNGGWLNRNRMCTSLWLSDIAGCGKSKVVWCINRALARAGTSYYKKNDLKNALIYYNKSLSEHREPEVIKKSQEVSRKWNWNQIKLISFVVCKFVNWNSKCSWHVFLLVCCQWLHWVGSMQLVPVLDN